MERLVRARNGMVRHGKAGLGEDWHVMARFPEETPGFLSLSWTRFRPLRSFLHFLNSSRSRQFSLLFSSPGRRAAVVAAILSVYVDLYVMD